MSAPLRPLEKNVKELSERQIHTRKLINNLETLYQVGRVINSIQTVEELLDHITESLLNVFGDVQRVCILLNENSKELEPKTIRTKAGIPSQPFEISWSIVNGAVKEEVYILANDASHDDRSQGSESILAMDLRSVMCAPLVNRGSVLGVIHLENREKPDCFDENDIALLSALASQSAVALDNSRLYGDIQKAYKVCEFSKVKDFDPDVVNALARFIDQDDGASNNQPV